MNNKKKINMVDNYFLNMANGVGPFATFTRLIVYINSIMFTGFLIYCLFANPYKLGYYGTLSYLFELEVKTGTLLLEIIMVSALLFIANGIFRARIKLNAKSERQPKR